MNVWKTRVVVFDWGSSWKLDIIDEKLQYVFIKCIKVIFWLLVANSN